MYIFWDNVSKFPKFLLSVMLGFFLTTFRGIFRLLTDKKNIFFIILIFTLVSIIYSILKLMLALN
uniref:Uncharacterized protein ycf33 n=1 Tax=Schizymenia dubyi TaxID=38368 RepID=A0A1C9C9K5_9FLOR|nr:hypothetical protein Schiz_166 [Schizymenia dubyi]AOM65049.1 hypothetical protein Schiz_166 [Schizymenia dubyi]